MRTLLLSVVLSTCLALAAGTGQAQEIPDPSGGYVVVLEPREWTGIGVRGITSPRPVRVVGLAHHPSGIQRVTINGTAVLTQEERSGATRFIGTITAEAASRDVQIVAYPVRGEPIYRVQQADGKARTGQGQPPSPAVAGLLGMNRPLRVSLAGLSAGARDGIVAALGDRTTLVAPASDADADLWIREEGGEYLVVGRDGSLRHHVPAPSGAAGTAALMPLLFQEFGALQLAELAAPASSFPVGVSFVNGTGEFRLGEPIELRVRSERDGYLTVVDLGTNGALFMLHPMIPEDTRIRAGEEVLLPSASLRAYHSPDAPYQAGEPVGQGWVRVFVTPRPLSLPDLTQALGWEPVARAIAELNQSGQAWGTAKITYRINP